jgi:hypothetical protein
MEMGHLRPPGTLNHTHDSSCWLTLKLDTSCLFSCLVLIATGQVGLFIVELFFATFLILSLRVVVTVDGCVGRACQTLSIIMGKYIGIFLPSCSMTSSVGAFHSDSGNTSTTTTSPLTERFIFSRPTSKTGLACAGTETVP